LDEVLAQKLVVVMVQALENSSVQVKEVMWVVATVVGKATA